MIVKDQEGRAKSVLTDAEKEKMLEEAFTNLSDAERKLVMAMLEDGGDNLVGISRDHLFRHEPVSMEQFLDDDYYLGRSCLTLYPKLREDLIDLFSGRYREVIYAGSVGWGKTTCLSIAVCRTLYELSCMISPQEAFGLSTGSEMAVALISKNLHLARIVLKTAVDDKLKLSPYFQEHWLPQPKKNTTIFPNNIYATVGSYGSERILGVNVYSGAMDETNFAISKKEQITQTIGKEKTKAHYDKAEKVYTTLVRRIKSRFMRAGGDLPGMMILVSSAATVGSFTDRRIEQSKSDPTVFIRDYSNWSVKPSINFSGKKFFVLAGNSSIKSCIVPEGQEVDQKWASDNSLRVIEVPVEYREDFEDNLEEAIRDIAGISTQAIFPYMQRIEAIEACVKSGIEHPFTVEQWRYGEPGQFIWERMCVRAERTLPGGYKEEVWRPRVNPHARRWVHIDPSLSGDCVTADTLVATPYGNRRIDSIVAGAPVYSLGVDGRFCVATATNPGLKKKNAKILRVVTDGGDVRCTTDHKFMLRDGTYRAACDLVAGDSLMPLYRKVSEKNGRRGGGGYEQFYQPNTEKYEAVHRLVSEFKIGRKLTKDECVHHVGSLGWSAKNKLDNRPENLAVMTRREHWRLHQKLIVSYNKSEKHRAYASRWLRWLCQHPTPALIEARRRNGRARCLEINRPETNPSKSEKNRIRASECLKRTHASGKMRENYRVLERPDVREKQRRAVVESNKRRVWSEADKKRLSDKIANYWARVRSGEVVRNHIVVRVEDAGREDVYCLSVDGCRNFVVVFDDSRFSSGVVVHNSTGIAMGHIPRWVEVVRRDENGKKYTDLAPYVVIDFMLRVNPPPGDQIFLPEVRRLVYELMDHGFSLLGFSTDRYQCLADWTRVPTSRGLIQIKDTQPGDMVQSRTGARPVKNKWSFGRRKTLRIVTEDGDALEGTKRHRIEVLVGWARRGTKRVTRVSVKNGCQSTHEPVWDWKRLGQISVGDVVRMSREPAEVEASEMVDLDSTLFGEKTVGMRSGHDKWIPPCHLDEPLAEVLGLLWGDGDIGCDGVRVSCHSDEVSSVASIFRSFFGDEPKVKVVGNRATVRFHSRRFVRWLLGNGFVKGEVPSVPEGVFRSPSRVQAAFLRGLFSADGSVSKEDGKVSLSTASKPLAEDVRVVLRSVFGIPSHLTQVKRDGRCFKTDKAFQYVVSVRGSRRSFAEYVGFVPGAKSDILSSHSEVPGRDLLVRVERIETGEADVYDLEVDEDPSYVAAGFMSHNSAEMLQKMKQRGVKAGVLSVDSTTAPYDSLKAAIYEGRIDFYRYEPFLSELKALEYDREKGKVDHPLAGKKDVSDAVAGVVYGLMTGSSNQPMVTDVPIVSREDDSLNWVSPLIPATAIDRDVVERLKAQTQGGPMPVPFLIGSGD